MLRSLDLGALNSATKYPPIPTYHQINPADGTLLPEPIEFPGQVVATEKVDGTNGRIVLLPSGEYVIGSREELLHARGDIIANPMLGIVDALAPIAETLDPPAEGIAVYFLEVYGGRKISKASKQYSGTGQVGARLFDVASIPMEMLTWTRERLAAWRENGGQTFLPEDELVEAAFVAALDWVPRLTAVAPGDLPTGLAQTRTFLGELLPLTYVALDADAGCLPEGIVFRALDRSVISKARFQDYDRTLRKLNAAAPAKPRTPAAVNQEEVAL